MPSSLHEFESDAAARGYYLKPGYRSRRAVPHFVDNLAETEGISYQPDVYPFAKEILRLAGGKSVLDLGCGRVRKLGGMYPDFEVIGVDFGANLEWCSEHRQFGRWVEHDFERGVLPVSRDLDLTGAGVICAGVIEHLMDPEPLLNTVALLLEQAGFALFSTPERDLLRGTSDFGPPADARHVREWNLHEFRGLLTASGMELWSSGLTCTDNKDWQKNTIIALARRKGWRSQPPPDDFRVVAIICAYNEADVIEHTLHYLTEQGIPAILIDNWSTDGTDRRAQAFLDKGLIWMERFPTGGPSGTFDLHNLLSRVEEIAMEVEADWVIHHDADEIRESPWSDLTLREGLYQVELEGYNCVNHTCIVFPPTPQSEERAAVVPGAFQYFEFGRRPGHFLQNKTWKKQPRRVSLADSGGHDVSFPGRTVYPLRFLLKHYPIRSREHGLRKVLQERLERINPRERRERGWHTQYESFRESRKFLRDVPDLILYDADRFEVEYMTERLAGVGIVR